MNKKKLITPIVATGGGSEIEVDSELSSTSENPVQNKVVKVALDEKQDKLTVGDNITIENNVISASGLKVLTIDMNSGLVVDISDELANEIVNCVYDIILVKNYYHPGDGRRFSTLYLHKTTPYRVSSTTDLYTQYFTIELYRDYSYSQKWFGRQARIAEGFFGTIQTSYYPTTHKQFYINHYQHKFYNLDIQQSKFDELYFAKPTAPTTEGTYTLKATVDSEGKVTYSWVAD